MTGRPADAHAETLRLDLLLWYLRFARSRSLAKIMVQSGKLRCNGRRIVKAHCQIGIGDVLTLMHGGRVVVVRLEQLPKRRGSALQAQQHYVHLVDRNGAVVNAGAGKADENADRENISLSM